MDKTILNSITSDEFNFVKKALLDFRKKRKKFLLDKQLDWSKVKDQHIFCDVDNTLILYIKDSKEQIQIKDHHDIIIDVVPHKQHIELLKKLSKNNTIIVWSYAGKEWADIVVKELHLNKFIDYTLDKPHIYIDDLNATEWMGTQGYIPYANE